MPSGQTLKLFITYLSFVIFTALVATDILTIWFPKIGLAGIVLWVATFCLILALGLYYLFLLIKASIRLVAPFTLGLLVLWFGLILYWLPQPASLSGEMSIETACAINHFHQAQDAGFHQTCLFGYPMRQHLIPAAPSLVFGRSLSALHSGSALYFMLGLSLFAFGLFTFFGRNRQADLVTAIGLSLLLHFYYLHHFLFYFEQSIFPLSFALGLVGIFFLYQKTNSSHLLAAAGLLGLFAIHAYTPGLALALLAILVLVFSWIRTPKKGLIFIFLAIMLVASLVVSLTYRSDLTFIEKGTPLPDHLAQDLVKGLEHLALANQGKPFTSAYLHGFMITVVLLGLSGFFGYKMWVISLWVCGIFFFALTSKGYSYYSVDFRLHRASVSIPVLLGMLVSIVSRNTKVVSTRVLLPMLMITTGFGLWFHYDAVGRRLPNPHYRFIAWLQAEQADFSGNLKVTQEAAKHDNLISLYDNAHYFFPQATFANVAPDALTYPNCSLNSPVENAWLLADPQEPCFASITTTASSTQAFETKEGFTLELIKLP